MTGAAIGVEGLTIRDATGRPVVDKVSFDVPAGSSLGIVGESGSGKTTLALAVLGIVRPGLRLTDGRVSLDGESVTTADRRTLQHLRRRVISYLGQDPATGLEPTMRVRSIVAETLAERRFFDRAVVGNVANRLSAVGLPDSQEFLRRFPHQLSGGQQQRIALARSLASDPAVLILDEPTTGLDVIIQELILTELAGQRRRLGFTTLVISHDLAVVARMADSAIVMREGCAVDRGDVVDLFARPYHAYTATLVAACPDPCAIRSHFVPSQARSDARPRLEAIDLVATHQPRPSMRRRRLPDRRPAGVVMAAAGVSLEVFNGECVALVGSSGSGKTTIARTLTGLHRRQSGQVLLDGRPLDADVTRRTVEQRGRIQLIPQDPYGSLNPRRTVGATISRPLQTLSGHDAADVSSEVAGLLARVRLAPELARRYPRELSGGERQRVAIARALAARPEVLICDEITSALDTSVQASILDLIGELRSQLGLAVLVITHDFGVVARLVDRIIVLDHGTICEQGPVVDVLSRPVHPTTRQLLAACRSLRVELEQREANQGSLH